MRARRAASFIAAASAIVVACGGPPEASPQHTESPPATPTADASMPSLAPPEVPTHAPGASQSPDATPTSVPAQPPSLQPPVEEPVAGGPEWRRIGDIERLGEVRGPLVGFADGYVVGENSARQGGAAVWFSPNGVDWQATSLFSMVPDCWGGMSPDAGMYWGATASEREVLLVGGYYEFSEENCAGQGVSGVGGGLLAWTSTDGITWRRSDVFGRPGGVAVSAWAIPGGGWEVAVSSGGDYDAVWRSDDGVSWREVMRMAGTQNIVRGAAAPDGTRLLYAWEHLDMVLLRSNDGVDWQPLVLDGGPNWLAAILPPRVNGPDTWLLASGDDFDATTIYMSRDLHAWQLSNLPGERTLTVAAGTSNGYVVSGEFPCSTVVFFGLGTRHNSGCDNPRQRQYISQDGLSWTAISPRLEGGVTIADGPAGVLLVGTYSGRVWQLTR